MDLIEFNIFIACEKGQQYSISNKHLNHFQCTNLKSIEAQLSFFQEQRRYVQADISWSIDEVCQRCLKPMIADFSLKIKADIASTQIESDNLWLVQETVNLYTLVEEEITLATPMVIKHLDQECGIHQQYTPTEQPDQVKYFQSLRDILNASKK